MELRILKMAKRRSKRNKSQFFINFHHHRMDGTLKKMQSRKQTLPTMLPSAETQVISAQIQEERDKPTPMILAAKTKM